MSYVSFSVGLKLLLSSIESMVMIIVDDDTVVERSIDRVILWDSQFVSGYPPGKRPYWAMLEYIALLLWSQSVSYEESGASSI